MTENKPHILFKTMMLLLLVLFVLHSTFCSNEEAPKNIILFIGDGMGVAHITAAKTVNGPLHIERCKTVGLFTTHAEGRYITDSAASGTAMATGHKTVNGAISVDSEGTRLKTVLEFAEKSGKSTGLVATCAVTHATPAAFAAHVVSRRFQSQISEQMAESGVDVLFGGGLGYFLPQSDSRSLRKDEKNVISRFAQTHRIVTTTEEFQQLGDSDRVVALLDRGHLPTATKREVSLAQMTQKAIATLSKNPNGFFLMVEGSQIDWEGHDNNSEGIIQETIDFDLAVKEGLDFAERNTKTLILITADHETGGYALEGGSTEGRTVKADFTTDSHTGTMVPLFAFGPGAECFGGIHDNTFIGKTMIKFITQ